ncbi:MAG: pseudaminic acid cytidylyltransferase [Bacteroidota bacterium]
MRSLAIIPARGGSKRIHRKNIKHFLGKPIIGYPVASAIHSNIFEEVMVSTDDEEIAATAKTFGASVPFLRSAANADDFATTVDVLLEVVSAYEKQGKVFDNICCIYPTAPFVSSQLLRMAFDKMITYDFDSVFPVIPFGFPIQRAVKIQADKVKLIQPEHLNTRSQDLEKAYHDCGQLYCPSTLFVA